MNKRIVLCAVIAGTMSVGCGKKHVGECDDFVATIDKIARCPKVDGASRASLEASAKRIKDALQMIDGIGKAPTDLLQMLRDTCRTQLATVKGEYVKRLPECVQ